MSANRQFLDRTQQDLSGYWPGELRLNPRLDVKAPEIIEMDFYAPLPWNLQIERLKWPSPAQELSAIVSPIQNQNFQEWNRKFAEGTIVYRKPVHYRKTPGQRVFLVFEGSNYRTEVKINGKAAGQHEGGHLAFEFEVTDVLRDGVNDFEIAVDNLRRKDAAPQEQFNWQNYGGIYRPFHLESRPAHFIRHHRLTPIKDKAGWHVEVEVETDTEAVGNVKIQIESGACTETFQSPVEGGRWKRRLSLHGTPCIWQPGTGGLSNYRIAYETAHGARDEVEGVFGLRIVTLNGPQVAINGKKTRILGAAWHEQHPAFGNAVPGWQVARDIQLMKQVGLNAIRAAHYPHAQDMYDACDRAGMLCVAELPCWQFNAYHFAKPAMRDFCMDYAAQMVRQLGNHPSIIGWSIQNESATFEPGAVEFFGAIGDVFKEQDPSRFTITAESPKPPEHLAVIKKTEGTPIALPPPTHVTADILGINNYAGCYAEKSDYLPKLLDHVHAQLPDKPLMVTEFGMVGTLGHRSLSMAPWTEDYQAELIVRHMTEILKRDYMAGFFLWLFMDYECSSISIGGTNPKGLVDEYRRPKLAFNAVKTFIENWRLSNPIN